MLRPILSSWNLVERQLGDDHKWGYGHGGGVGRPGGILRTVRPTWSFPLTELPSDRVPTAALQAGPLVLPWSEKLAFAANWVARKALGASRVLPYVPDFRQAFDHFCLHAGELS